MLDRSTKQSFPQDSRPGSSNLNLSFLRAQQKFCVNEMKEKCLTFCFLKLKAKVSSNHGGEGDFPVEKLGFFFQS